MTTAPQALEPKLKQCELFLLERLFTMSISSKDIEAAFTGIRAALSASGEPSGTELLDKMARRLDENPTRTEQLETALREVLRYPDLPTFLFNRIDALLAGSKP